GRGGVPLPPCSRDANSPVKSGESPAAPWTLQRAISHGTRTRIRVCPQELGQSAPAEGRAQLAFGAFGVDADCMNRSADLFGDVEIAQPGTALIQAHLFDLG